MKVRRSDLEECGDSLRLDGSLLDLGIQEFENPQTPVVVDLMVQRRGDDFRLRGTVQTCLTLTCDRCLESLTLPVEGELAVWIVTSPHQVSDREVDEVLLIPAHQDEVDLSQVISDTIYLEIPRKIVCREDCRGLCPGCGADLNRERCHCPTDKVDERWSALATIKQKLKE